MESLAKILQAKMKLPSKQQSQNLESELKGIVDDFNTDKSPNLTKKLSFNKRRSRLQLIDIHPIVYESFMVALGDHKVKKKKSRKNISLIPCVPKQCKPSKRDLMSQKTLEYSEEQVSEIIYQSLLPEQKKWLKTNYPKLRIRNTLQFSSTHIELMLNSIAQIQYFYESERLHYRTREKIEDDLRKLRLMFENPDKISPYLSSKKSQETVDTNEEYDEIDEEQGMNQEIESRFLLMIDVYKVISQKYCPTKRRVIKRIFKCLEFSQFRNSIEVLRFLESEDKETKSLEVLNQELIDKRIYNCYNDNKFAFKKIASLIGMQKPSKIQLIQLSNPTKRRKVITVLISGFMTENCNKKRLWDDFTAVVPQSEVYALEWQSSTLKNVKKYIKNGIKDILTSDSTLETVFKRESPFSQAFDHATNSGNYLAYVLNQMFPHQIINLVCFSLGVELGRVFLEKSIEMGFDKNIGKITLMGGVSNISDYVKTLEKSNKTLSILNLSCKNDAILKHILPRAKPDKTDSVGMGEIPVKTANHRIINMDVTNQISGHLAYMRTFHNIADKLKLNSQ